MKDPLNVKAYLKWQTNTKQNCSMEWKLFPGLWIVRKRKEKSKQTRKLKLLWRGQ